MGESETELTGSAAKWMIMQPDEWERLIAEAATHRPAPVMARTFRKKWSGFSNTVLLLCYDEHEYAVKGRQAGRGIVNDQVVARLGEALGAPVAPAALVTISDELIAAEPELGHMPAGVCHGTQLIEACRDSDKAGFLYTDVPENRSRFALLAVLYGWAGCFQDHQFVYPGAPPHLVYSVDHGHFFPSGPNWSIADLAATGPAVVDQAITTGANMSAGEIARASSCLRGISNEAIAAAVATPPDEWQFALAERVALATYLAERRDALLQAPGVAA